MSTTLETALTLLSKDMGDYWASTTTSAGAAGGTTLIDTALMAKANDWISDAPQEMYDRLTSGTYDNEERKISSLSNTAGTLTVLAHGGQVASAVTYEIHRLFSASEKRRALKRSARLIYPHCYKKVRDDSLTFGNWLRDGDFEHGWTSSSANSYWIASTSTQAKNTTAPYYWRGVASLKLTTAAGYSYQSNTQNPLLNELAGKSVTFKAKKAWCDTASCLRLSIYDGTTTTYSDYHDGDSVPAELSVTATIATSPSQVRFAIHHAQAAGTSYVDDARVLGPTLDRLYITDLGIALDRPFTVEQSSDTNYLIEPWQTMRNYEIGSDGYIYFHEGAQDYRLRISGIGYLDFLSSGAASEDWAATIELDEPQTYILSAKAVMELYTQMISPNYTSGDREKFAQMIQYWDKELENRIDKFAMPQPPVKASWAVSSGSVYKNNFNRINY